MKVRTSVTSMFLLQILTSPGVSLYICACGVSGDCSREHRVTDPFQSSIPCPAGSWSAVLSGPEESFAGGKVQRNGENTKHEAKQQGRHEKAGSEVEIAGK